MHRLHDGLVLLLDEIERAAGTRPGELGLPDVAAVHDARPIDPDRLVDVLGVPAASITYYAVPPLGSFLAVLALWRLIASWEVSRPLIACAA